MNLVRAISLSGGAADLQGDDSTKLICRVQLIVLAVDFVFNILADTFLKDPLLLLVIFICQVFLLIVGFIFYMMASANQAMKEGIHEKLLRHHQVTAFLWTAYFSLLLWWYIWSLKRSWPSAGDHFSFTLHRDIKIKDATTLNPLEPAIIPILNETNEGLLFPEGDSSVPDSKIAPYDVKANATTKEQRRGSPKGKQAVPIPWTSMLIRNLDFPSNNISKMKDMDVSDDRVNRTQKEELKFFWSPGFIALYVAERSISLLFYTANILGTLHIMNSHLGDDDDDKDFSYASKSDQAMSKRKGNRGPESIMSASRSKFESPKRRVRGHDDHVYFESDSNLDDNGDGFIRQLEDQDGDPFENEQYNYSYHHGSSGGARLAFNERNFHSNNAVVTETETDEGETGYRGSADLGPHRHLHEYYRHHDKRRKKPSSAGSSSSKGFSKGKSRQKLKSGKEEKNKKTKGSLRNMMIMAHLEKSTSGQQWSGNEMKAEDGNFMRRKDSSPSVYRRMPSTGDLKARTMATAASVEMIGTGSTDELLVAQVVNVHDGYSNPWIGSEEMLGDKRDRTDSV